MLVDFRQHQLRQRSKQAATDNSTRSRSGFTIVELLTVIVVIGILAAITIVAYNGVTSKARNSSLVADLNQAAQQLGIYQATNSAYPTTLAAANFNDTGNTYSYTYNNAAVPNTFCVTASNSGTTYVVVNGGTPAVGTCQAYTSLVGWWKFNGGANDSSTSGYTGTLVASPTLTPDINGQANSAYAFNGDASFIYTAATNFSIGHSDRSVFAWVDPVSYPTSGYYMIDSYGGTSPNGGASALSIDANGYIAFNAQSDDFDSSMRVATNSWHFVGYQIFNNGTQVTLWYDGSSQTITLPVQLATVSGTNNYIGSWVSGQGFIFNGAIDDVRVFSNSLSAAEIQTIYKAGPQ
jgi:prepilin-type N-terminal cleavage/methylation domain-containing protein